ncbi:hypothetical protein [Blastococcus brunescens]|uniref:Uncharacterized protein n=1 Tax=Blastococcus brunescens TaxID=1564165 RepID=A0ABZ1B405_9ACTN|nr:hypothetical protein [Blastococcus sp. BMG 8361]WRL65117.1 hypothetical protein U6N30_05360 [Blastococcus sp. BMG 8361]
MLGEEVNERVGTSSDAEVAWFATAFPCWRGSAAAAGSAVPPSRSTARQR